MHFILCVCFHGPDKQGYFVKFDMCISSCVLVLNVLLHNNCFHEKVYAFKLQILIEYIYMYKILQAELHPES